MICPTFASIEQLRQCLVTLLYYWLVVEHTPLKNMTSSVGMMTFPIDGKIKFMFQTTNQVLSGSIVTIMIHKYRMLTSSQHQSSTPIIKYQHFIGHRHVDPYFTTKKSPIAVPSQLTHKKKTCGAWSEKGPWWSLPSHRRACHAPAQRS